ncbi:MAG: 3-phosphoshikimate 1-carboxyvinyltransferase [Gammaproteobacteria bacterium]|nr:3-phosphoshikimate 1-carboxyvinyltransferase [Gammaproteobacteria bacterium]
MGKAIAERLDYRVEPGGSLSGIVRVPGDKSISHRAVILGSIAEGETNIDGLLQGNDVLASINAMRALGVEIDGPEAGRLTLQGVGLHGLHQPSHDLDLGNSGTGMRLLCGLLSAQQFGVVLTGDASLLRRPMQRIVEPLRRMGAQIHTSRDGRAPLRIDGGAALSGIYYSMPVASAQVKSTLLLAGLYASEETCVAEPAPTRDHTERMLRDFGYEVRYTEDTACVSGGGVLQGRAFQIPGDLSSATFFLVGATIATDSNLRLEGVGINPSRRGVLDILRDMGADIQIMDPRRLGGEPVADLVVRSAALHGIRIPKDKVPLAIDEFPAILIAAACASGETVLSGAEELRVKESDRISAMAQGLRNLGVEVSERVDGVVVRGGIIHGGEVDSHGDHRVAMAFAMAGIQAERPILVRNCDNVATSFPDFVGLTARSGLNIAAITATQ